MTKQNTINHLEKIIDFKSAYHLSLAPFSARIPFNTNGIFAE